jgi:hypothetical protein
MSDDKVSDQQNAVPVSQISQIVGPIRLLPGESADAYRSGLVGTIKELGAITHLQTYIAEKIFQCMWWMRRYEVQKQGAIINAMGDLLSKFDTSKSQHHAITQLLQAQQWQEPAIQKIIEANGQTTESLLAKAMSRASDEIQKIDQLIAIRVKTLGQLQQSYEALVNRSVMHDRLKLQNELLRRDLQAIDLPAVQALEVIGSKSRAKSKAKSGQ